MFILNMIQKVLDSRTTACMFAIPSAKASELKLKQSNEGGPKRPVPLSKISSNNSEKSIDGEN